MFGDVFAGQRVLVTGDTGFKGSWLASWLIELGADVYGYALPPRTTHDNFAACQLGDKIHHRDGDIRDFASLLEFCQEVQPTFVFHLAAQSLVLESYREPRETFEVNVLGTVNLLEAVRLTPSVRVALNVTSDKCYENKEWVWDYRETDPLGWNDPYSASKAASEIASNAYAKSFANAAARIASVRAGNVIGGGDWAAHRVVPDFFRAVAAQTPLVLRNPEATRPWQFVLEPLSGYLQLASRLLNDPAFIGAWNFGPMRGEGQSVRALITRMSAAVGPDACSIRCEPSPYHESGRLAVDISKAMHVLKWRPVLNFDETVQMTVDGYIGFGDDLYASRLDQIREYVRKGKTQRLAWTEQ